MLSLVAPVVVAHQPARADSRVQPAAVHAAPRSAGEVGVHVAVASAVAVVDGQVGDLVVVRNLRSKLRGCERACCKVRINCSPTDIFLLEAIAAFAYPAQIADPTSPM